MIEPNPRSVIKMAKLSDISELAALYLGISFSSRKLFHPFPKKLDLHIIILIMILSDRLLPIIRRSIPKVRFLVLVVEDELTYMLMDFTYLLTRYKDVNRDLVANRGIVTREGIRSKGVGAPLDSELIRIAKKVRVDEFSVSALKHNSSPFALHKKMGYQIIGQTEDKWNNGAKDALILELEQGQQ